MINFKKFPRAVFLYIIKNYKLILISLVFGFTVSLIFYSKSALSQQADIANEIIRFHVLANSDSSQDQALKLKVRNEIIKMLSSELEKSSSKTETKEIIIKNLDKIKYTAQNIIISEGYDYPVNAELAYSVFPTKTYADIMLPSGRYEALRILIGEAKGKNWWCVMFPPLCLVDGSAKEIPDKDKLMLKGLLTEEEFELINQSEKPNIKIKFKIIEILNNIHLLTK